MDSLVQMMAENQSPLLKVLFNELSYLISNKRLKALISILAKFGSADKNLEVLLGSQALKTLYYAKVTAITSYKGSFEQFHDKYIDKFTRKGKACIEVLQKGLVQSPYAAGFGTFLVQRKRKCEGYLGGLSVETMIGRCRGELKDFDCYRLGRFSDIDQRDFEKIISRDFKANSSAGLAFVEELRKRDAKYPQTAGKVQGLLLKASKGDVSGVKSKLSSDIPKEAIPSITGLRVPEGEIKELEAQPFDY